MSERRKADRLLECLKPHNRSRMPFENIVRLENSHTFLRQLENTCEVLKSTQKIHTKFKYRSYKILVSQYVEDVDLERSLAICS